MNSIDGCTDGLSALASGTRGGERRAIEAGDPGDRRRRSGRADRLGPPDPGRGRPDPGVARRSLRLLEELPARKVALEPEMAAALAAGAGGARRPQAGSGQQRRPALLRRGPLSLRPAGQGQLRGRAARQQHAARLRPGQGELGRRLPDQPGGPADRGGDRPDPHGREGRAVLQRRAARRPGWPASCSTGASTTSGPTSARTSARPTSGSPRPSSPTWPRWSSTRSTC